MDRNHKSVELRSARLFSNMSSICMKLSKNVPGQTLAYPFPVFPWLHLNKQQHLFPPVSCYAGIKKFSAGEMKTIELRETKLKINSKELISTSLESSIFRFDFWDQRVNLLISHHTVSITLKTLLCLQKMDSPYGTHSFVQKTDWIEISHAQLVGDGITGFYQKDDSGAWIKNWKNVRWKLSSVMETDHLYWNWNKGRQHDRPSDKIAWIWVILAMHGAQGILFVKKISWLMKKKKFS